MRIFVIGDSISMQYGPYLEAALVGVADYSRKTGGIEGTADLDVPQGANGGDSSMVLAYLEHLAAGDGLAADILLVNCGLHDIKRDPASGCMQVPIGDYEANLKSIVDVARRLGVRLVWIRTTPCDEYIHNQRCKAGFLRFGADVAAVNAIADRIMRKADVPIIDLHTFTLNLGPDIYCDHVHFHEHVRQRQGAYIAGWLGGAYTHASQ